MTFQVPADAQDPAYATAIIDAIQAGDSVSYDFVPVTSSYQGHTATFLCFQDALKIDGVRWGMGAELMQQVADMLGCVFDTPKIRDLRTMQRGTTLEPVTYSNPLVQWSAGDTTETALMRKANAAVETYLARAGGVNGIVATVGKPWVLTNLMLQHPGMGINYGWEVMSTASNWEGVAIYPPASNPNLPFRVIQQPSWAHGLNQADYAQTCLLTHRTCTVDGKESDILDLLQDPILSYLASHEGPLKVLRQPGVPIFACINPHAPAATPAASRVVPFLTADPTAHCPTPPAPSNVVSGGSQASGIDWATVGWTGLAAAGVVAAFFAALKYAGRPHSAMKKAA